MTKAAKLSLKRHLAEKVMGWKQGTRSITKTGIEWRDDGEWEFWDPLTDANAALEVLNMGKCESFVVEPSCQGPGIDLTVNTPDGTVYGAYAESDRHTTLGSMVCEAICLACAKATGWEEPE